MNEAPTGIKGMYSRRGEGANFGPPTYTSQEFLQKIYTAAGLDRSARPIRVLDSMSGPGLLGSGLQRQAPFRRYYFLDLDPVQLSKIPDAAGKVAADALHLPFKKGSFRVGVIRYAAKDIERDAQPKLFYEMSQVIARRGRWVLADMYAPLGENDMESGQIYEWLNYQHAAKQERSGRNPDVEGTCHIPMEQRWLDLFELTGLRAEVMDHHISYVTTTDWLKSNQVTENQLEELNQMILSAPRAAKKVFNIREEDGLVKIDYPVTIIRAVKP